MRQAVLCAIGLALASFDGRAQSPRSGALESRVRYHYECVTERSSPDSRLAWTFGATDEHAIGGTYWRLRAPGGRVLVVTSAQAIGDGEPPASPGYDPSRCRVTARDSAPVFERFGERVERVGWIRGLGDALFLEPAPRERPRPLDLARRFPSKGERVRIAARGRLIDARVADRFPADGYFLLEGVVESFVSGAPVLDAAGRVYGVVTHADKPAAFVRRIDSTALGREIRWGTAFEALRRD
jgi:hypothetical protein